MRVDLSIDELAAIIDALKWNVAKQTWLRARWHDRVAREGHRLRQEQAERVLEKLEAALTREIHRD